MFHKRLGAWVALLVVLCLVPVLGLSADVSDIQYVTPAHATESVPLLEALSGQEVLGRFFSGTQADVLGIEGDYARVQIGELEGYMETLFLSADFPQVLGIGDYWWGIVNVPDSGQEISLRAASDAGAEVLATYPNGTVVVLHGEENDFYFVRTVDAEGFLPKEYIVPEGQGSREMPYTLERGVLREDGVALRSYPSRDGAVMERLDRDASVQLYAISGPWYYVGYTWGGADNNVQFGFILGTELDPMIVEDEDVAVVVNPNEADRLNLRAAAGTESSSIGRFFGNQFVKVLDRQGDWWQVQVGDEVGFMQSGFLREVGVAR